MTRYHASSFFLFFDKLTPRLKGIIVYTCTYTRLDPTNVAVVTSHDGENTAGEDDPAGESKSAAALEEEEEEKKRSLSIVCNKETKGRAFVAVLYGYIFPLPWASYYTLLGLCCNVRKRQASFTTDPFTIQNPSYDVPEQLIYSSWGSKITNRPVGLQACPDVS